MKTNRKFTVLRLLLLGALVAGFNAKPASAQVIQGKFTLPSVTRWGSAMLPAGDYSFTVDKNTAHSMVTVYRGTQSVALILPAHIRDAKSDRSEMVLQGGTVRELSLPQIGVSLYYPAHNPGHRAVPEEEQLARIIPVTATGAGR